MAYNLAKLIELGYKERDRNEPQSTQPLISASQPVVNNQVIPTNDSSVEIVQPNQQNDINPRPLNYVTESYESIVRNNRNTNDTNDDGKINGAAAILVVVLYAMSISLVVYGSTHLKDCPAQKMIPMSYLILGSLLLFSRILSTPDECRKIFKIEYDLELNPQTLCRVCLNFVIQIATICIFCALCYWVFHLNPDTKEDSANYCEKELYKNTYYGCIVGLSLVGIIFFVGCCGICVMACIMANADYDP